MNAKADIQPIYRAEAQGRGGMQDHSFLCRASVALRDMRTGFSQSRKGRRDDKHTECRNQRYIGYCGSFDELKDDQEPPYYEMLFKDINGVISLIGMKRIHIKKNKEVTKSKKNIKKAKS